MFVFFNDLNTYFINKLFTTDEQKKNTCYRYKVQDCSITFHVWKLISFQNRNCYGNQSGTGTLINQGCQVRMFIKIFNNYSGVVYILNLVQVK